MRRRACLFVVPSIVVLLMAGCTVTRNVPVSEIPRPQASAATGGEVLVALPYPQTLFGPPLPAAAVQPGSLKLKSSVVQHPRLVVSALPSSLRTAALALQEKASGKQRWGEVMIPEERKLFLRFAQDTSLGDWLIMITDVDVTDAPDPIPYVVYRWARADVEAYAKCGIPQSVTIERCTETFFRAPEVIFLHSHPVGIGQ